MSRQDTSDIVRLEAVEALAAVGPGAASAVPALTAASNDRSRRLRTHATAALGKIAPGGG